MFNKQTQYKWNHKMSFKTIETNSGNLIVSLNKEDGKPQIEFGLSNSSFTIGTSDDITPEFIKELGESLIEFSKIFNKEEDKKLFVVPVYDMDGRRYVKSYNEEERYASYTFNVARAKKFNYEDAKALANEIQNEDKHIYICVDISEDITGDCVNWVPYVGLGQKFYSNVSADDIRKYNLSKRIMTCSLYTYPSLRD